MAFYVLNEPSRWVLSNSQLSRFFEFFWPKYDQNQKFSVSTLDHRFSRHWRYLATNFLPDTLLISP